ncbi:MAG: sodium/proline symporter [Jaaginema sp. PMC 1079.18]|nr:sodium/proline symporter [Jaaginema sp. PMC 1080.18]MEC4850945.1 sodium/proline symporter [Jaaginema sp. PMC 1079.18]MEC4867065.1 sodium/proline symporter [Jaaginema sp. PMC 1078.18]
MNSVTTLISFSLFLVVFLGVGAIAALFSQDTESDYLLGDRAFGRIAVGLSAGATSNSAWIMIAGVGAAYTFGLSSLLMPLAFFGGDYLFWHFFSHKINKLSVEKDLKTIPEFLSSSLPKAKGKEVVRFVVAIIMLIFVGTYICAQFSAAAKTLNVFFGLNESLGIFLAAGAILLYCVAGGLRASIWTDIVQAVVVVFVAFGMLAVVLNSGGGIGEIWRSLRAIDPDLVNITAGYNFWTLIVYIVGFFCLGFGFDISQPHFLVRLLASRNPNEAKQAQWVYLTYVYSTWIAMLFFGIIARILIPSLDDPEQALPFYAMQSFNPVLVGIVLAGVFSLIASTADSQILVCSSTLARDISPKFYQKMSRRYGVKYEQFMTLIVGILAAIATNNLTATVFSITLFGIGAVSGSIGPAMLVVLTQRPTHYQALSAMMLAGMITSIIWRLLGYGDVLSEALPSFIVALITHEVLMRMVFKPRLGSR